MRCIDLGQGIFWTRGSGLYGQHTLLSHTVTCIPITLSVDWT